MFSDESTLRLLRGSSKIINRPGDVSRYDLRYLVKTVKHPDSVMVWGAFNGNKDKGGFYFFSNIVVMDGSNYIDVWRDHMRVFWDTHECDRFILDNPVAHKPKAVKKFLHDNAVNILEWPDNSPDIHPKENARKLMKNDPSISQI